MAEKPKCQTCGSTVPGYRFVVGTLDPPSKIRGKVSKKLEKIRETSIEGNIWHSGPCPDDFHDKG